MQLCRVLFPIDNCCLKLNSTPFWYHLTLIARKGIVSFDVPYFNTIFHYFQHFFKIFSPKLPKKAIWSIDLTKLPSLKLRRLFVPLSAPFTRGRYVETSQDY